LGAWRGKVPLLKHQKLPGGLGKRSGKFDSQSDQQAKYAAQQGRTEVLEGEPERDSTDGQCVERTSKPSRGSRPCRVERSSALRRQPETGRARPRQGAAGQKELFGFLFSQCFPRLSA